MLVIHRASWLQDPKEAASKQIAALASKTAGKLRVNAKVDSLVPGAASYKVYSSATETYDAMLNQFALVLSDLLQS